MLTVLCPGCLAWQPVPKGIAEQLWGCDACEWTGSIVGQPRSWDRGQRVVGTHPVGDAKKARAFSKCRGRCAYCGKTLSLLSLDCVVEHVRSRCEGGTNNDRNLVVSCRKCNERKGREDPEGFRRWVEGRLRDGGAELCDLLSRYCRDDAELLSEVRALCGRINEAGVVFAIEEVLKQSP